MAQKTQNQVPEISPSLQTVLQHIVNDTVTRVGCIGALVTTLENGQVLPIRAAAHGLNGSATSASGRHIWEQLNNHNAVIHLNDWKQRKNLSVRAVKGDNGFPHTYLLSNNLHELLHSLIDKSDANQIQTELNIQQAVAIPFLLGDEVVGNLLAASQHEFSKTDIEMLIKLGQEAVKTIQTERDLTAMRVLERIILKLQAKMTDETEILQAIVNAMVSDLGYAGAIVATLENGRSLPVRTYSIDVAANILQQLEDKVGVSLSGPQAVVYLDEPKHQENISVQAVKGFGDRTKPYLITDKLHDLLRPIVMKPLADLAQRLVGFKQIIAVPFFLEDEIVGNLFVATKRPSFTQREIQTLITFAQQAAVGLRNARLYAVAEERRSIAEKFGRMAFSATAAIHDLRNHVGVVRNYLHLLKMLSHIPEEQHQEILGEVPLMMERLSTVTNILDNLHEPWQQMYDQSVDVNDSLIRAIREVSPGIVIEKQYTSLVMKDDVTLQLSLKPQLAHVLTAEDMLTEAFRIVIKNAVDALLSDDRKREIWVSSLDSSNQEIEVTIRDSGRGIRPADLAYVFDMGWSTKEGRGMGFGLFWAKDYLTGFGGDIWVESKLGGGATFHIRLPIAKK